jgi:hypothetical protein
VKAKTFKGLLQYFKKCCDNGSIRTGSDIDMFIDTYFPVNTFIETAVFEFDSEELDEVFGL